MKSNQLWWCILVSKLTGDYMSKTVTISDELYNFICSKFSEETSFDSALRSLLSIESTAEEHDPNEVARQELLKFRGADQKDAFSIPEVGDDAIHHYRVVGGKAIPVDSPSDVEQGNSQV